MPCGRCSSVGSQKSEIHEILAKGVIIEDYPADTPYPSCLVSGIVNNRPIHVVMATIM